MKKQRVFSVFVLMFIVCLSLVGKGYAVELEKTFSLYSQEQEFTWNTPKSAVDRYVEWYTEGGCDSDDWGYHEISPFMNYVKYSINSGTYASCGYQIESNDCDIPDGDGKKADSISFAFKPVDGWSFSAYCDGLASASIIFKLYYDCADPATPTNFTYSFNSNGTVTFKWDAAKYANRYKIYREWEGPPIYTGTGTALFFTTSSPLEAGYHEYNLVSVVDDCDPDDILESYDSADVHFTVEYKPIAKTEPVDTYNITENSATLKAVINPQAAATTYYFEYGTTTSYGSKTPSVIINDTEDNDVDYDLTRLTPNTTYHFRVVASNSKGTTYGNDQTFTTEPAQQVESGSLTVTILPAEAITAGALWQVDTGTWQNSGATVSNLSVGSHTVNFKDVAGWTKPASKNVTIQNGQTATLTETYTQTSTGTKPTTTTEAASSISSSSATLNGTVNPNGAATTYYFQYGLTTSYGSTTAIQNAGSGTTSTAVTANITGLTAATAYHFRVVATNSAGTTYGDNNTLNTTFDDTSIIQWQTTTPLTFPRYGAKSIYYNGYLYITGGSTNDAWGGIITTNEVAKVNIDGTLGAWSSVTSLPYKRTDHTVFIRNGYIYIVGGWKGWDDLTGDIIRAKINGNGSLGSWENMGKIGSGEMVHGHATVINGDYIYVMGGWLYGSEWCNRDDVYISKINGDGTFGTWIKGTKMTSIRGSYDGFSYNGRLYMLDQNKIESSIIKSDGTIGEWITALTTNYKLCDTKIIQSGKNLFFMAVEGTKGWARSNKVLTTEIEPNGTIRDLTEITSFNTERANMSCALVDNTVYVLGGWYENGSYLSDVQFSNIILEQNNVSVLFVFPGSSSVSNSAGTTTFAISNTGTGTMAWSASVTSGSSWLSITSGSSGSNSGTITCSYSANTTTSSRTGTIRVTANGATGSPVDITVVQAAGGDKPTVTTGDAGSVTATTATLSGTLNPNGIATSYYFEYGTTTSYGSMTPAADGGSGTTIKTVTANLTGLAAGTTYHFRLVATNSVGTTNGNDQTFTTVQQVGSLTVTISPSASVNAGAQWQVDGGAWNNSDATVSNLTVGNHTVEFKDVTGWTKPASQTVTISNGQTATATGTYTQQFGSLTVTISPANAVTAGAQWQVDGGTWNNSSATVSTLTVGNHTVSFKDVTGWTKPASQTVTISNGQTATATGTYTQQFGSLTVTISPSAAVTAGAQWQVDGGAWNNSSATVSNLTVGNHTVEFKDVTGWTKPEGQTVTISNGQTATATGTYISLGTKPTATTGTATSTTATTATLNGTLNPNGLSTNCYFEYGLTTSYGKVTATQSKGLGTTSTAVTANITGLTAATAYHFRVVATNSAGTTYGSDGTFTTTEAIAIKLVPVPDTGITKCYNDSVEIPCPTAGQDFYGQDANYSINSMSYTKLDATGNALPVTATTWAMVRDNVTGLIWENKTDDGSIHDKDNTYTWYDSNNSSNPGTPGDGTDTEDFIKALNDAKFGGYSDWHLPTIKELASIVDYSIPSPGPTVNTIYFNNIIGSFYWSSKNNEGIWLSSGNADSYGLNSVFKNFVIAVSGSYTSNNFIINGDDTVTDSVTGLMWQQDKDTAETVWKDAISYCDNLNFAGYTDWRLPTIKELRSICDYSSDYPFIDTNIFYNTSYHWSSSSNANNTQEAWVLELYRGSDSYRRYDKQLDSAYVRAVRGGQTGLLDNLVISVIPASRSVSNSSGTTTFEVSNTGTGTMAWSDYVTSGGDWLSISSGSSGSNSGTITCSYQANTTALSRTATIRVTANGAAGSPVDITVVQAAGGTKPTATTGNAGSITAATVALSGTLNPNGLSTAYYFEYGTTTSYGSKTPAADGGSGTTIKTVTANLTGLTAGTTYHFRLVGTNSAGTTNGSDKSFTTTVNPATDDYGNNCTAAQVVTLNSTTNGKIEVAGDYDYFKVTLPSQGTLKVYTSGSLDTLGYLKDSACTDISDDDDDGDSLNFLISEDLSAGIYYIGVKSYETKTGDYTLNVEFISVTAVGSLQVTILPANAVNAGAMWRVDAGVWNNSGATVLNITVGTHTVDFKDVAGWTKPANQTVTISNGQTATATGTYISLGTKPTATTGTATSTTAATATLNGTLNPNGLSTNCYFEYGLTTAYGKVTATQSKGSGTTSTAVTAAVTGLTANTTYHFRIVGTNSAGTTYSSDKTFTTSAITVTKPTATTGVASLITDNSAKLSGTITPKGASTTYYFEYGATTTYGKKTAVLNAGSGTAAVAVNADLVGFNAGTTYHFRLVATNSAGTAYGTDKTFTTTVPPTTVLKPTVTTEPATSIITTSAKLNGTVNPNGDVTNYYFEYGTTTSYGSTTRSPRSGSDRASFSVNKSITGLAKATIYHFRIVAINSAGTTYGLDKTFTTLP